MSRICVCEKGLPAAAIMSAENVERVSHVGTERNEDLDSALERMRTAFADVPEEQLEQDVAEVIERIRIQEREKTVTSETA